jgi:hypothetical protein
MQINISQYSLGCMGRAFFLIFVQLLLQILA